MCGADNTAQSTLNLFWNDFMYKFEYGRVIKIRKPRKKIQWIFKVPKN